MNFLHDGTQAAEAGYFAVQPGIARCPKRWIVM
jgi:hypothetical protein